MQVDLDGNVPEVVIDIHETKGKSQNSVKHLMQMMDKEGIRYIVEKIPIGDVLGVEGVAIERKTVNDLVNTLKGSQSGVPRFTKQMDALLQYERPYLLIENILSIRRDPLKGCIFIPFKTKQTKGRPFVVTMERASYIHPNALDALLESVKEKGIELIMGFNALHSAGLVYGILFPEGKDSAKAGQRLPTIRTRKGLDSMKDEQEFFIAGFPGVNVVRAKSLLKEFGNPLEVVSRTDEWSKISGIGPKTITNARRMLTTTYKPDDAPEDGSEEEEE